MRSVAVARSDRCAAMRSPNKRHHHVRAVASSPGIYGCPPLGGLTNSLHALDEYLVGNKKLVQSQQETRQSQRAPGSAQRGSTRNSLATGGDRQQSDRQERLELKTWDQLVQKLHTGPLRMIPSHQRFLPNCNLWNYSCRCPIGLGDILIGSGPTLPDVKGTISAGSAPIRLVQGASGPRSRGGFDRNAWRGMPSHHVVPIGNACMSVSCRQQGCPWTCS